MATNRGVAVMHVQKIRKYLLSINKEFDMKLTARINDSAGSSTIANDLLKREINVKIVKNGFIVEIPKGDAEIYRIPS